MEDYRISEKTIFDISDRLARLAGRESVKHRGFITSDSGRGAIYSRHTLTGEAAGRERETAAEIMELIKNGGPRCVGYTEEVAGAGHGNILRSLGFVNFLSQVGMYLYIDKHDFTADISPVSRVGRELLDPWEDALNAAFPKPSERDALELFIDDPECGFFAWRENGVIAGTALAYCQDGVCGMHEVGTLSGFRGRGICRALLEKCMLFGLEKGCSIAALQSNDAGYTPYIRIGFTPAGHLESWRLP